MLNSKLKDFFNTDWKTIFGGDNVMPLISSCMMPPIDDARYESIDSYKELRESLEENLRELLTQPGTFGMNLVRKKALSAALWAGGNFMPRPRTGDCATPTVRISAN